MPIPETGHVEPVPRRIRARLDGSWIVDTIGARYFWEWPPYPGYLLPTSDVDLAALPEGAARPAEDHEGYVQIDWSAVDSWFEEDEQVFVHPRSPYVRVDALRSDRHVQIKLDDDLLADSTSPVMVFETGLPTRYYLERTSVDFERLQLTETVSECPYKGRTSSWWSIRTSVGLHEDLAWGYDFPTRQLLPIAGLVAFYDEKVDVTLDGVPQERPKTHFFEN